MAVRRYLLSFLEQRSRRTDDVRFVYWGHARAVLVVSIIQRHWYSLFSNALHSRPIYRFVWVHHGCTRHLDPEAKGNHYSPALKVAISLAQLLLPVVIIVELLFLLTLPVTGLAPLWGTGNGTALLMALTGLALLGTVVYFGETPDRADHTRGMHVLITIGMIALPTLSLLSAYGLSLRVLQYGWTVERCWALAIWVVLTGFAISYALAAVRHRRDWFLTLDQINRFGLYGSLAHY